MQVRSLILDGEGEAKGKIENYPTNIVQKEEKPQELAEAVITGIEIAGNTVSLTASVVTLANGTTFTPSGVVAADTPNGAYLDVENVAVAGDETKTLTFTLDTIETVKFYRVKYEETAATGGAE